MGWANANPQSAKDHTAMQATAAVRGVSEYQIFVDAYREWHGRDPGDNDIEPDFGRYLRSGVVPEVVRHYLRLYKEHHPEQLASYSREQRKADRIRRISFWLIVLMVILALAL
jgi:hypothetical protein